LYSIHSALLIVNLVLSKEDFLALSYVLGYNPKSEKRVTPAFFNALLGVTSGQIKEVNYYD